MDIPVTMASIVKAFTKYKQTHGEPPGAEGTLPVDVDLNEIGLDNLIKGHSFPIYDSQAYNRTLAEILSKGMGHNGSCVYDALVFSRFYRSISRHLGHVPETTLQIGPGGSLGCEVLLSMLGVRKAFTLDPFPLLTFDLDNFMNSLKLLLDVTGCFRGINGFDPYVIKIPEYEVLDKAHFRIGESTVQHFFPRSFEETGFENDAVDFLFSVATFEHVRDPLKCIREAKRILKPGGVTVHCIDLRDHRDFNRPLNFLHESDESWRSLMEEYCRHNGSGYMNRWRAGEFVRAFEGEGFEILEMDPEMKISAEALASELPYLDQKYRSLEREDLATISMSIVARRKNG